MINYSDIKSMRRLREWVHPRLVGAAAFPSRTLFAYLNEGDIFTLQLRGHIDFA
jgi:hypothetical protein